MNNERISHFLHEVGIDKLYLFFEEFGHLVWPVLLGFVGIYLLLPQPRRSLGIWGALASAAALVALGWSLTAMDSPLPENFLFYVFSGSAILAGVLLITQKNPVHAALSFALVVLSTCGLFLLQGAPFLMAATVVVYAGAIVVTFLFVIMLAQQAGTAEADQRSREPFLASLAGFVLVGSLLCVLHRNYDTSAIDKALGQLKELREVKTADDIKRILGDPEPIKKALKKAVQKPDGKEKPEIGLPLVKELQAVFPDKFVRNLEHEPFEKNSLYNLEHAWFTLDSVKMKEFAADLYAQCLDLRARKGSLLPAGTLPLSVNSGPPPNVPRTPTSDGKFPERLPARNVAAVGKALFTDYLVPVDLAGMLLLVATIGAIAIAGRRGEGMR